MRALPIEGPQENVVGQAQRNGDLIGRVRLDEPLDSEAETADWPLLPSQGQNRY
jgi:hypothetical protein